MSFYKKTIRDIDIAGKRVLLRTDYNVPLNEKYHITDDYRIKQSLPTIRYLLDKNCKVIICSHLGRPKSADDISCSLRPVARRLGQLLDQPVEFAEDCVGQKAEEAATQLYQQQILVLENLRFHPEEETNDSEFAKRLASLAEVFVQDGFGVVHRAHASTDKVTSYLPSVAGLLLEKEVDIITNVMENPRRPLAAIIGGAKIADKIDVLNRFLDIADFVAVGGAMANTFLLAEGIDIGKSVADIDDIDLAREVIAKARHKSKKQHFIFYLPQDGVVATSLNKTAHTRIVDWDAHVIADIENYPKRPSRKTGKVAHNEMILDIGPFSGAFIAGGLQFANTVVWNGAMGVTETPSLNGPIGPFAHGTDIIAEAMLGEYGHKPFTVVGGGDTVGYIEKHKLQNLVDHVSTGGGASLELMAGKKLPGVEALLNKE
ncbi:phosphoglycerate kinase [Candidatus Saccharibacteria bacterium]|nr:phosphoglycerate kinase [Candidatus Saccharibacteria bacterium]MBI3338246.1 phosphoglycerate kinase [Candidatus Saccharibacteria bacterium]